MSDHRRDDEGVSYEHMRADDVPGFIKWGIYAIEKIGITAVVIFALLYMMFVTMGKSTNAINNLTVAMDRQSASLEALIITVNGNHSESKNWKDEVKEEIHDIGMRLK